MPLARIDAQFGKGDDFVIRDLLTIPVDACVLRTAIGNLEENGVVIVTQDPEAARCKYDSTRPFQGWNLLRESLPATELSPVGRDD